jgi:hypothetical protein
MLGDWFVGMILLFTMHYIMIFANTFVDLLTDMLSGTRGTLYACIVSDPDGELMEELEKYGFYATTTETNEDPAAIYRFDKDGTTYLQWNTDLMGRIRFELKYAIENSTSFIGYTVMFVVMIIYLCMFLWVYIKRVIYMAFLTVIAPLVAFTYPIDKANDGRAQGFDYWFKEYMFNLLLQPVHLLLYTILVSSAIELATQNIVYAIVALGFMIPAEKILRQIFNFGKASTPGVFGGVAGGALAMSGIRWLTGHGPHGGKGGGGSGGDKPERDANGKIYTNTGDKAKKIPGMDGNGSGGNNSSGNSSGVNTPGGGATTRDSSGSFSTGETGDDDSIDNDYLEYNEDGELVPAAFWNGGNSGESEDDGEDDSEGTPVAGTGSNAGTGSSNTGGSQGSGNVENRKRHLLRATAGAYIGGQRRKYMSKEHHPFRSMAKAAGGLTAGATLGMVGLAAGVASGDATKAFQYAGVGMAGGAKLGSNIVGAADAALRVDGVGDAVQRERLGEEEYQRRKTEQNIRKMSADENNIRLVQQKLKCSRSEARELLPDMIRFGFTNNVTDINDMLKIEKVARRDNKDNGVAMADARQHAQWGYGLNGVYGSKDYDKARAAMERDYPQMTVGQLNDAMNWMINFRNATNNL